jgi:rhodanese-related sulfurtransferase
MSERKNVNDMVREAKARIEELSVDQLQAELDAGTATLIDIRDPRELWEKGAIPGARSMPRGMLEFWCDPESKYYKGGLDFDERYVLYCAAQRSPPTCSTNLAITTSLTSQSDSTAGRRREAPSNR